MKRLLTLSILLGLASCTSPLASLRQDDSVRGNSIVDELRMEVAELKHTLHAQQVDMQIIEEKLQTSSRPKGADEKISKIENDLARLQRFQETCLKDLKNLQEHIVKTQGHTTQVKERLQGLEQELSSQGARLGDLRELKGTLSSLKKAIASPESPPNTSTTYKVKSGDSLEKIARHHGTTVDFLKNYNELNSDAIRVGQVLKVPYGN